MTGEWGQDGWFPVSEASGLWVGFLSVFILFACCLLGPPCVLQHLGSETGRRAARAGHSSSHAFGRLPSHLLAEMGPQLTCSLQPQVSFQSTEISRPTPIRHLASWQVGGLALCRSPPLPGAGAVLHRCIYPMEVASTTKEFPGLTSHVCMSQDANDCRGTESHCRMV